MTCDSLAVSPALASRYTRYVMPFCLCGYYHRPFALFPRFPRPPLPEAWLSKASHHDEPNR